MDRPIVESIVDTFPVEELAKMMDLPVDRVRATIRGAVLEVMATGGSIDNMRAVVAIALRTRTPTTDKDD